MTGIEILAVLFGSFALVGLLACFATVIAAILRYFDDEK